jgi:hypothetical protein
MVGENSRGRNSPPRRATLSATGTAAALAPTSATRTAGRESRSCHHGQATASSVAVTDLFRIRGPSKASLTRLSSQAIRNHVEGLQWHHMRMSIRGVKYAWGDLFLVRPAQQRTPKKSSKVMGHIGDTVRYFLLLLERYPVRPCSCSLLEFTFSTPLSRRQHGFKSRRGRQDSKELLRFRFYKARPGHYRVTTENPHHPASMHSRHSSGPAVVPCVWD